MFFSRADVQLTPAERLRPLGLGARLHPVPELRRRPPPRREPACSSAGTPSSPVTHGCSRPACSTIEIPMGAVRVPQRRRRTRRVDRCRQLRPGAVRAADGGLLVSQRDLGFEREKVRSKRGGTSATTSRSRRRPRVEGRCRRPLGAGPEDLTGSAHGTWTFGTDQFFDPGNPRAWRPDKSDPVQRLVPARRENLQPSGSRRMCRTTGACRRT